jgi:exopolysaccharide biosynthesis polyprenyl glycosylphosphotransferase
MILLKHKKILSSRVNVIYASYVGGNNNDLYENFQRYAQLSGFNFNVLQNIKIGDNGTNEETSLADLINFEKTLKQHPCDQVIFAQSLTEKRDLGPFLRITNEMGIVTRVLYDVYTIENYKWYISTLGLFPMITYYNVVISPISLLVKRLMDIIGSLAGIVLSFPIMLITAIAIKIDTPGPVFFKQERVGLNRKKFYILKFRSMVANAEKYKIELIANNEMNDGRLFKMKNDPRITKVGKIIRRRSIDELPQFFNVLKGEMSLVGTRPPTVFEVEQYERHHHRRISMKPGITGIWQTSGRNKIRNFEQIVQMDTAYIDNWSLLLDIKLLFKTIKVLLNKEGAY